MGDSYKNLTLLLEECTKDHKYIKKNRVNYLRNRMKTTLNDAINLRREIDDYVFSDSYEKSVKFLKEVLPIYDNEKMPIENELSALSINDIDLVINDIKISVDNLRGNYRRSLNNIEALKNNSYKKIGNDFILKKCDYNSLSNLLFDNITKYLYNNFNLEIIRLLEKKYQLSNKYKSYDLMKEVYDKLLGIDYKGVRLIYSRYIKYDKAKEYCNSGIEDKYYSNIRPVDIFNNVDIIKIDYSNYKKYLVLDSSTNLFGDIEANIETLFVPGLSKKKYMISNIAYFSALQDLKVYRGKKKCWVCGKKLGIFTTALTCSQDREFEKYL